MITQTRIERAPSTEIEPIYDNYDNKTLRSLIPATVEWKSCSFSILGIASASAFQKYKL